MPNALILANGIPPSRETVANSLRLASLFVCADGGANVARGYGLTPHAIVGDLDSVTRETLATFRSVPTIHNADEARTDAEKAVDWILARGGIDEITLLGATAGRLDHVLGHLSLLIRYHDRVRVILEDDGLRALLAREAITITQPPGTLLSFFAVGGAAEGVTTANLRYPLREHRLELGLQDSISNVVDATPASILIARGTLLVVIMKNS